jgi:hypothetical protein
MARKKDENQTAFATLEELLRRDAVRDSLPVPSISPEEKDPKAVKAGRLGGLKGGKIRAKRLSEKRRRGIAKKAANARWQRTKS